MSIAKTPDLLETLQMLAREMRAGRGPSHIHPGQWSILRYVESAPEPHRTVGGVATHLGCTHAPASRATAALIRKGLVAMQADHLDRRVRRLSLTAAGRAMLARDPFRKLSKAVDDLPPERRVRTAETIDTLLTSLIGKAR